MMEQIATPQSDSRSSAWHALAFPPRKRYHSPARQLYPDWDAVQSIDVVTVCEDPRGWKSLAARSMRGEKCAYRQLLEEFAVCLELFFARLLPDDEVLQAVDQTLQAVSNKLCTCDVNRPILPWLLAIARYRAANPAALRRPN